LRQANRLFEESAGPVDAEQLSTITARDIAASRVFATVEPSHTETSP
ncbi:CbbX protein, partial [Sinorhizobium meliloti]